MSAEKAKEKMEKRTTEEKNNVTPKKGNFPRKNAKYHGTGQLPCPEIGENWTMEQVVRQQGKSAGRYDTYYYSPDGVKIRSRLKLQQHLNRNLDGFDYNTGKFIKNIVDKTSPSARGKMDKIKTSELKTIDRFPRSTKKSIINKQSRVRGPYSAALQMHKRRKKQKGLNKQRTQHNSKDMSTSAAIQKAIAIVDRDNVKKQPFILFRNEAMQLAGQFPDFDSDFEDLIICAWNCLSLESKKQYEECTYTGSPENVTNVYNTHNVGCSCNICNNDKKGKKRPYFSEMRRKRCGLCTGCRAKNCGSCDSCRDMKKFGGSGSRKQSCVLRRCVAIHSSKGCMRMVPRHLHTSPFSLTQSLVGSPPPASFLDYSPLIPLSYHSDGSLEKTSHRDLSEHDFEIICAKQIDCTDLTRNSGLLDADKIDTLPDSCQLSPQITSSNLTEYEIHGQKIVDVDPTVSNTSTDIPIISEQNISQKLHKRKSRIPVYIKQNEIEREVDILVE